VGTEEMTITVPKAFVNEVERVSEALGIDQAASIQMAFADPARVALALSFGANLMIIGEYTDLSHLHSLTSEMVQKGYMQPCTFRIIPREGSDRNSFEHSCKVTTLDAVAAILRLYANEIRNHGLAVSRVLLAF